jgi:addiction module HigA family antidote
MPSNKMRPIHPGEILREEFLAPLHMTPHALAVALRVPASRVNDIVLERRCITADTAARLARFFGTTPEFWLNLQTSYDLKTLATKRRIERDVQPLNLRA